MEGQLFSAVKMEPMTKTTEIPAKVVNMMMMKMMMMMRG